MLTFCMRKFNHLHWKSLARSIKTFAAPKKEFVIVFDLGARWSRPKSCSFRFPFVIYDDDDGERKRRDDENWKLIPFIWQRAAGTLISLATRLFRQAIVQNVKRKPFSQRFFLLRHNIFEKLFEELYRLSAGAGRKNQQQSEKHRSKKVETNEIINEKLQIMW